MRIAYLVGRYPAISKTFVQREVDALRRLGVDVDTFSVWRSPPGELLGPVARREFERTEVLLPPRLRPVTSAAGVVARNPRALTAVARAFALGPSGLRRIPLGGSWALEALSLFATLRARGVRHVHAHLAGTAPTVALLVAALGNVVEPRRWGWSFTAHGSDEFADVYRERLVEKIRSAAFVVAVSEFTRAQLLARVDEHEWSKVHVVHCGVDPEEFVPQTRSGPTDELRLVTVGRLAPAKGHAILIEAVRLLVGRGVRVRLVVVGDGPSRRTLVDLVRAAGIDGLVDLRGALAPDDVREELAAADVFCLTSFMEGVPTALMEAMAMGIPVVASGVMGVPELVESGANGLLVPPGRAALVADAVASLADDAELRRRLGEAGRATVLERFDVHASARALRDLFAEHLVPG